MDDAAILATASSICERTRKIEAWLSELLGLSLHLMADQGYLDQAIEENFVSARIIKDHIIRGPVFLRFKHDGRVRVDFQNE